MTVRRGILAGRFERSPLRRPAFARLCAGYAIAGLGHQFSLIALLWFVLDLTNSGAALGLVVICMQLPGIVTSALFGRLLDRVQPRNVLAVDNILRALLIAAIPLLHWFGALNLEMILAFAVLSGALAPATTIGLQVMFPDLVPDEELDNANALISFTTNMPYFIGPAIAGLLVAWWGGPVVILLDAIGFIVMATVSWSLPTISRTLVSKTAATVVPVSAASPPVAGRNWFGFGILWQYRPVLVITLLSLVFFFSYGPLEPALPIYARDTLQTGATGYGLLWGGMGLGMLVGLIAIPVASRIRSQGKVFASIAILWGLFLLPLAFLTQLPLAIVTLFMAGAAFAPYTTMKNTLIQRLIPPHVRGQVFGAQYTILIVGSPMGAAVGGILLDVLSAPQVIAISGIACIVAGIAGLTSPALRGVRRDVAASIGEVLASSSHAAAHSPEQ